MKTIPELEAEVAEAKQRYMDNQDASATAFADAMMAIAALELEKDRVKREADNEVTNKNL